MKRKGAIGLSVNVLVILIISVVILGFGISFLYTLMAKGTEFEEDIDKKTMLELERLLMSEGEKVALPLNKIQLFRGDSHVFGVGVLNIKKSVAGKSNFRIVVTPDVFIDAEDNINTEPNTELWEIEYYTESFSLGDHEHDMKSIYVEAASEASSGTYQFNVDILDETGDRYGIPLSFYVVVK